MIHAFGLLGGEILGFRAVLGEIVKIPRFLMTGHQFPITPNHLRGKITKDFAFYGLAKPASIAPPP